MARKFSKKWIIIAIILVVGGVLGYKYWKSTQSTLPAGIASGNGRIEAKLVDAAAKEPLRVKEVLVDEGDLVKPGQVLARLDTVTLEAEQAKNEAAVAASREEFAAAQAAIAAANADIASANADIVSARAGIEQKQSDIRLAQTGALCLRRWLTLRYLKQRQVVILVADAAERLGRPQRLPPGEAERAEGIGVGEPLDHARRKAGAQPEIAHGRVAGAALGHDDLAVLFLRQSLDLAQAEPQRG